MLIKSEGTNWACLYLDILLGSMNKLHITDHIALCEEWDMTCFKKEHRIFPELKKPMMNPQSEFLVPDMNILYS